MKYKAFRYVANTKTFYAKLADGQVVKLGGIKTKLGGLTRQFKLDLIDRDGAWMSLAELNSKAAD